MVIKLKKKKFPSLLSPGEEIIVRVYALYKINKNRKPHTIQIDSFVIPTAATALKFGWVVTQQNRLQRLSQNEGKNIKDFSSS